jgi:protein TonB
VRNDTLGVPIFASLIIHILVILVGSVIIHHNSVRHRDFLPIDLVDVPQRETRPPAKKIEVPPEIKKPPPPSPPKVEKPKAPPTIAKPTIANPEAPPPIKKEEPAKAIQAKPTAPAKLEPPQSFASGARIEGGGSEAGAGNLYGNGDIGVVPGTGTAGGGGGMASSGPGRGSGAPGLPAQAVPLRIDRQAKPIQTVRASYPPMALRAGLESDVTLKIEVDAQGNVTKAEIIKSGGGGFDEEALKAVRQSRFEPAQKDGHNVAAEFTYVYRFRLRR